MNMIDLITILVCIVISIFIGLKLCKAASKEKILIKSVEKCKFNKLDSCYEKMCGECIDYEQCPLRCDSNCEECYGKVKIIRRKN